MDRAINFFFSDILKGETKRMNYGIWEDSIKINSNKIHWVIMDCILLVLN